MWVRMRLVPPLLIVAALLVMGSAVASVSPGRANAPFATPLAIISQAVVVEQAPSNDAPATATRSEVVAPLRPEPAESPTPATAESGAHLEFSPSREPLAESSPVSPVDRAVTARFAPIALVIPRIGVEAAIVPVGITPDGRLEAPPDYTSVGWHRSGPAPGEAGRAVLDGHVDSQTGPAVFYRLGELALGNEIRVRAGGGGPELTFVVRETALYWTDEVSLDTVYSATERPELVLITCGGPFDRDAGGYLQRRIVVAELRNAGED